MNYFDAHEEADTIFYEIKDKPYSEAAKIINSNASSESEYTRYVWECVRARMNSQTLNKKNNRPEYMTLIMTKKKEWTKYV